MKKILLVSLILSALILSFQDSYASFNDTSVPYKTYTQGPNNQSIATQTAYQPIGYFSLDEGLERAEDMVIFNDTIYILNSGSKEVLIYGLDSTFIHAFSYEDFNLPTGIAVDETYIYVADKGAQKIFKFDHTGLLVQSFGRPTEPIFGINSPFIPTKIEVGPRGIMYIVGEGSTAGIIQLASDGAFLGFFATNQASNSWLDTLSDLLGVQYALNVPSSASNLKMDDEGSLYTISPTDQKPLKRFNIASVDTLEIQFFTENLKALAISNLGNILTLSSNGYITEYDPFGRLIFSFGGLDPSSNRISGLLVLPVDIEVSDQDVIYILDQGLNAIQMYVPTSFTQTIHEGLVAFNDGIFDIDLWQNVLSFNEMFALANQAIGQASYRNDDFETALYYFELAQYKEGYSNTYWQIRYVFLQESLGIIFLSILGFFVLKKMISILDSRYLIYQPFRTFKAYLLSIKIIKELSMLTQVIKRPYDVFYDIKHRHKGSYLSASILYGITIIMTIIAAVLPSFLFRTVSVTNFSILSHTLTYTALIILFVFSNYLIATLNDGEGFFKDIYIGFAYSIAPLIIFTIPLVILSHGLTLFESFIYQFLWTLTYLWTALYTVLMLKDMHGYSIKALIKNILLTIVTILLLMLLIFISYLLLNQVFDYIFSLIKEVLARA